MSNRHQMEQVATLIQSKLVELSGPSLAVAVAREGEILWETAYGWADRERRIPASEHTMYSLASISKPITATGLMVLAERDLIDLDVPVNDYLGEAKLIARLGDVEDATVRQVANHTAGLPLHYQFFYEDEPYRPPSRDESIRRYGQLVTPPGESYQYANFGYGVLDYLIERLSGKRYEDFMREEVFLPLGLTRSSIDIGPGLEPFATTRYGTDGLPIPFYSFDHPGASAVFSSAHDLIRFGMFHLKAHLSDQRAILNDASIDAVQQPTAAISEGSGYGIGWRIEQNHLGYRRISHTGGMGGVNTQLTLLPEPQVAVAVLSNASSPLPGLVTEEILSAILPEYATNRAQHAVAGQQRSSADVPLEIPPELHGEWEGVVHTWVADLPLRIIFRNERDIHVRLGDPLWTLLNDVQFHDGLLTGQMLGDIGTEDANRRPYHLHLKLKWRGDVLNGCVTAISLPGKRMGNALSYWAEVNHGGHGVLRGHGRE